MQTYMLTLFSAALLAALVGLLAPEGEGGRLTSQLRMVAGLLLLLALLEPLRSGLSYLRALSEGDLPVPWNDPLSEPTLENYEEGLEATLIAVGQGEVEAYVKEVLETVFHIPREYATVGGVWDTEGEAMTLVELRIALRGAYALENPHPMEAYFSERLGCPCYVTLG